MIEVVETDAEQPWHVKVTNPGNEETLVIGENLKTRESAFAQIIAVAKEFGVVNPHVDPVDEGFSQRETHVLVDGNGRYCGNISVVRL